MTVAFPSFRVLFAGMVLFAAACAGTPEPARSEKSPTAINSSTAAVTTHGAGRIVAIDDVDTTSYLGRVFSFQRPPETVTLAPGSHTLIVSADRGGSFSVKKLELVAQAGRTYVVKVEFKGYEALMRIEEERP